MNRAERNGKPALALNGIGCRFGDYEAVAASTLVVADGDEAMARALAEQLAGEFFALREQVTERGDCTVDEALDEVMAALADGPLVLCEQGDNHLGGSAGDGTFVLGKVVERGIGDVAFGPIWDPMSVDICQAVGEGERLTLRVGGKSGPEAGQPVDLQVTIRKIIPELWQEAMGPLGRLNFGTAVWVSTANGIDLILHSTRSGTLRPNVLTDFGIDLSSKKAVIGKMWRHGEEGFRNVGRGSRIVCTPGAQTSDFATIPYRIRTGNWWPRVADPFASPE